MGVKPHWKTWKSVVIAALFGVIATPAVQATELETNNAEVLERVTSSLNAMDNIAGDFVQVGPDGTRVEGKFYMDRPGKLRFEYNPPSALQIVADGFWVAIQDKNLKTTEKYPLAATPLKLILARNVNLNRDARVVDVFAQPDFVTVTVEARSEETPGSLALMFDGDTYELRQWTVTDAQGLDTSIALSNLRNDQELEARLFRIIEDRILEIDGNR